MSRDVVRTESHEWVFCRHFEVWRLRFDPYLKVRGTVTGPGSAFRPVLVMGRGGSRYLFSHLASLITRFEIPSYYLLSLISSLHSDYDDFSSRQS